MVMWSFHEVQFYENKKKKRVIEMICHSLLFFLVLWEGYYFETQDKPI